MTMYKYVGSEVFDGYSVILNVTLAGNITFHAFEYPVNATFKDREAFLDAAEAVCLDELDKEAV